MSDMTVCDNRRPWTQLEKLKVYSKGRCHPRVIRLGWKKNVVGISIRLGLPQELKLLEFFNLRFYIYTYLFITLMFIV